MSSLAIIHFSPLELYPPVQNLLIELDKKSTKETIIVFTTNHAVERLREFNLESGKIKIMRIGRSGQRLGILMRYFNYLYFYCGCILGLLKYYPDRILYFETLSSFPAFLYKRFIKSTSEIYIHYHEYTSLQEFRRGMILVKWFHRVEKLLYPVASWISHTNEYRMQKFKNDLNGVVIQNSFILSNFPPKNWYTPAKKKIVLPVKIVYAGALSLSTMYTKEFAHWIIEQKGKVHWDIYSYNCTEDADNYLQSLKTEWIKLKHGVNYDEMPEILRNYDVGVILYNGHIPNYIYNAPNKLFEYLSCGLDVWFPNVMIGSLPYVATNSLPKALAIDFTELKSFDLTEALARNGAIDSSFSFYCEDQLKKIIEELLNND